MLKGVVERVWAMLLGISLPVKMGVYSSTYLAPSKGPQTQTSLAEDIVLNLVHLMIKEVQQE